MRVKHRDRLHVSLRKRKKRWEMSVGWNICVLMSSVNRVLLYKRVQCFISSRDTHLSHSAYNSLIMLLPRNGVSVKIKKEGKLTNVFNRINIISSHFCLFKIIAKKETRR